jgi:ribosomal protein L11 methyltransferase
MTDPEMVPPTGRESNTPLPYQDLYIYYIEGLPQTELKRMGQGFIGNWEEGGCSFLFFKKPANAVVDRLLETDRGLRLLDRFEMTYEEWQGGRITRLETERLIISPAWEALRQEYGPGGKAVIRLDPGVVFGTGLHITTRDCLTAVETACAEASYRTVLDLGTGTGVLAIAAAKLGCERVLAVDLNPLAVQTARDNIQANRLAHRVLAVQGKAEEFLDTPADLLIANIHYDVTARLIAMPGFLKLREFILSGLLRSQAGEVAYQLRSMPVTLVRTWTHDGIWTTFFGRIDSSAGSRGMAG